MEILTPEEIAKKTDHLKGLANIQAINKLFRAQDESHLYPINNQFNATDRAIRIASRVYARANGASYGLEYALGLDHLIGQIVNSPNPGHKLDWKN